MYKIFLSILAGLVLFISSCSNDDPEETLPNDKGDEVVEGERIRVMAYNIHHANPPSKPGVIDIDAIVRVIKNQNPDIVALQEVDVNTERSGSALDQAKEIATQLGMNYYFGKALDYQGGGYGVAILSKYSISEETVHQLPSTNVEQRVLATAKVTLGNGEEFRFGSTHLDASNATTRMEQIEKIGEIASEEVLPFIIAGDFNATPDSDVIKTLDYHFNLTCRLCPPTVPVNSPTRAIDFIAYKHPDGKFSIESHKVINETYASDHRPVFAIIILEE